MHLTIRRSIILLQRRRPRVKNVVWKPELWQTLVIQPCGEKESEVSPPTKSFFDYQDPAETYEVRGILPRADLAFKDQD